MKYLLLKKIAKVEMDLWKQKENHESDAWIRYGELHAQLRILKELLYEITEISQ